MVDLSKRRKLYCLALSLTAFMLITACNATDSEQTAVPPVSSPPKATTPPEVESSAVQDFYPLRYYNDDVMYSLVPPLDWLVTEAPDPRAVTSIVAPDGGAEIIVARMEPGGWADPVDAFNGTLVYMERGVEIAETTTEEAFNTLAGDSGSYHAGLLQGESPSRMVGWAAVGISSEGDDYLLGFLFSEADSTALVDAFRTAAKSFRVESSIPLDFPRENALVLDSGEPLTLDPALTHFGGGGMIGDMFSGLVTLDPYMQVQPALAKDWELSADGTIYTFHLHPEARFHNGRPVTAHDVLFSWERAAHPDTNSETVSVYMGDIVGLMAFHEGNAETIEGVRILDDRTLEVEIDGPKAYFLAKLTYPVSWVVDRHQVEFPDWDAHPNGTGPFRHLQHLDEAFFILERNPLYYGEPPRLDYVVYLIYAGYTQRLYQNGEVDWTGLTRDQLERAENPMDGLYGTVYSETGLCTFYVTFDTSIPPFDDPLVRRAFVHAIDRERYVEAITNGEAVVGRGLLPPGMPGFSQEVLAPVYDPDWARELLAQSGHYSASADPPEIVWTLGSSSGYYSGAAAFLVDSWTETLGIDITVEGIDWESYYDQIDAGNYGQLLLEGWCADYPDPENFLDLLYHSASSHNHAHYSDPVYDDLIEAARTEQDVQLRLELYQQAEQHLLDTSPALFLSHTSPSYGVWKPYVRGYVPSPIGVPQNHMLWIER